MSLFADKFFFFAYLSPKDRMHEHAETCFDLFNGRVNLSTNLANDRSALAANSRTHELTNSRTHELTN